MPRDPIFGQLHPDLACAIALGIVDNHHVSATLETITVFDVRLGTRRSLTGWLDSEDALDNATREYLSVRREATLAVPRPGQSSWAAASNAKIRETANLRALQARSRAWQIIQQRGVLSHARRAGLTVTQPA